MNRGGAFELEVQRGNGDAPADRILRSGLRTGPPVQRLELESRRASGGVARPSRRDVGARGVRVDLPSARRSWKSMSSVPSSSWTLNQSQPRCDWPSWLENHSWSIQADTRRPQRRSACLRPPAAGTRRSGMPCPAPARLLADAVLAVNHGRRARREAQREADVVGHRGERLGAVADPSAPPSCRSRCAHSAERAPAMPGPARFSRL